MPRIKLKQVDQIWRKSVSDAQTSFIRHCQLKNLAPYTVKYYKENLQFFLDSMFLFNNVRKLSRVQPMPYKYVKTWFENRFPYYSEQPSFDADGFVIDPATLTAMKEMVQEVAAANQMTVIEAVPAEVKVA